MTERIISMFKISPRTSLIRSVIILMMLLALLIHPTKTQDTFIFIVNSLYEVSYYVIPGIIIAAWIQASGASGRIAQTFNGNLFKTVILASLIGSVTPVCGITVLPLMTGLLTAGVPLAPVMAFWLSSPVTDPAMLATTAATLGLNFAIGKTLAAAGLGLLGGSVTALISRKPWVGSPLRQNILISKLGKTCMAETIKWDIWRSSAHRAHFQSQFIATTRLILICLIPAFAAEFILQSILEPASLTPYIGDDIWWSIPLAVIVGAPMYLDGYAALPLTRSLIDHGMSIGAAMAFLVSGGVVSIWGAMAIFPVLKIRPFLLYLVVAITGSIMAGFIFGLILKL
ncbi:permease [Curvivirga sp.]|uniref:permease n=1 Tax=Curvivirga sp. TaxID=2856848 RepID=UPI003B58E412